MTNPKNPQAAGEGLREIVGAAKALSVAAQTTGGTAGPDAGLQAANDRLCKALAALAEVESYFADRADVIDGDYGRPAPNDEMRMQQELEIVRRGLNPAIAPGGDGMSAWIGKLGALVSAAKDRDLSAKDHAEAIDKAHSELFDTLRSFPAAGNAVPVDDAAIKRAVEAWYAHDPEGPDSDRAMRRAIAALAQAAATPEHTFPGDTCKACHPELAAPADPPAAGDRNLALQLLAAQEAIVTLRQQPAAAIAERERAVNWVCHNGGLLNEWAAEWRPGRETCTAYIRRRLEAAIAAGGEGDRHG